MQNFDAESGRDLRLRPRLDRRPRPHRAACPTRRRPVREGVLREDHRHPCRPPAASQAAGGVAAGRRGFTPAVDRISRDTTDLLVIVDGGEDPRLFGGGDIFGEQEGLSR